MHFSPLYGATEPLLQSIHLKVVWGTETSLLMTSIRLVSVLALQLDIIYTF